MLAANRLPEILQTILNDGAEGVVLMTQEGSLLSFAFAKNASVNEIELAAISSSVWGNLNQGNSSVSIHLVKLERGHLGITSAGRGYLLAAYGTSISIGLLKSRLLVLSQYFTDVFDQIK